jgi:O-antigen ligase
LRLCAFARNNASQEKTLHAKTGRKDTQSQTKTLAIIVSTNQNLWLRLLDGAIFYGLIVLIAFTAIPYGTVEPWSHAIFESAIFVLTLLWVIHGFLSGSWGSVNLNLFYPLMALIAFATLQSLSWSSIDVAGLKVQNAISADPFESWVFALRLSALTVAGILAVRFTHTRVRLGTLVHAIVLAVVISAIFGILRQAMQHQQGFLLTALQVNGGFAQFINKNHFAFLVEAAMGLLVGIALLREDRYEGLLVYLSAILLLWVALVMSRSRGGLLAVTVEVICAVSLFVHSRFRRGSRSKGSIGWQRPIVATLVTITAVVAITIGGVVWLGGDQLTTGVETASIEVGHVNLAHEGTRRSDFWRATWKMARAHPLAGAGLGGFWAEVPVYHDGSGLQTPHQAHNDYLELLASGGVIGVAIFVGFAVLLIGAGRKAAQNYSGFQRAAALGAVLGIVGIGVHSLFEFGLHITINALVFMILLSILSLPRLDQRPEAQAHRTGTFN